MLTSHTNHQLPSNMYLVAPGETAWRAVNLELNIPYLFFLWSCKDGPAWVSTTTVMFQSTDVVAFCAKFASDQSTKIRDVAMLLPSDPGNGIGLRLLPISDIYASCDPGAVRTRLTYVDDDGRKLDEHGLYLDDKAVIDGDRVYAARKEEVS